MALKKMDHFSIDDDKHQRLWEQAVLVFDTSSLLEFYHYSDVTQQQIIDEIFEKLQGRLWLPNHVNYEFLKNRGNVIEKPLNSYNNLEQEMMAIVKQQQKLVISIGELKSKTKKNDKHPFLDHSVFEPVDNYLADQQNEINKLNEAIKLAIAAKIAAIQAIPDNDKLLKAIDSSFEVGDGFKYDEILKVIEEGKLRYEFKIPPGYKDCKPNNSDKDAKEGIQIFGDLIIWKEILAYAKQVKKPIILISNDTKSDWCYRGKDATQIDRPKEDLLREMYDCAEVEFWMYTNLQLLYFAKKYLNSLIGEDQINEVSEVSDKGLIAQALGCEFVWPVNEETSFGKNPLAKSLMYLIGEYGMPLQIDWGDGSDLQEISGNNAIYHQYPGFGEYRVKIYGAIQWFCAMAIGGNDPDQWVQYPKVRTINFSKSESLYRLQCVNGSIEEIDLSGMPNINQLLVDGNQLKKLDVGFLDKLNVLYCGRNQIELLNLADHSLLKKLRCDHNHIKTLDLTKCPSIEELDCAGNNMTSLVLGNNRLSDIDCSGNSLSAESLNAIFRQLPDTMEGKINIRWNTGANSCNRSIATDKGWQFIQK